MKNTLAIILLLLSMSASADSGISVERPWMRPTAISTGAVYLTLHNGGGDPALLTGVECAPANCMIHQSSVQDGIAKMRMLDTLTVPPHGEILFEPGGLHIMAIGLKAPLAEGAVFPIILHFKGLPDLTVIVDVRKGDPR